MKKLLFTALITFCLSQLAFGYGDRVGETTTTTGTGTISLAGAKTGYVTFNSIYDSTDTVSYLIQTSDGTQWEIGKGTFTDAATDTLSRDTVEASSNSGAKVVFSAGTKSVYNIVSATDFNSFGSGGTDDQTAAEVPVTTTSFGGIFSNTTSFNSVQECLDAADDHNHSGVYEPAGVTATEVSVTTTNFAGNLSNDSTSDTVQECLDLLDDIESGGGGYTNLTDFDAQTAWRIFYSNADGDTTELALGDAGKVLTSGGASNAPTWETPATLSSGRIAGLSREYNFTIPDPNGLYSVDTQLCIDPCLPANMTITRIDVTCDANPTTELDMDLKWADAFIGLANATVIEAIDTTNGVTTITSGIDDADIASGKCIYLEFGAEPDDKISQVKIKITYDFD